MAGASPCHFAAVPLQREERHASAVNTDGIGGQLIRKIGGDTIKQIKKQHRIAKTTPHRLSLSMCI